MNCENKVICKTKSKLSRHFAKVTKPKNPGKIQNILNSKENDKNDKNPGEVQKYTKKFDMNLEKNRKISNKKSGWKSE